MRLTCAILGDDRIGVACNGVVAEERCVSHGKEWPWLGVELLPMRKSSVTKQMC